jgi:hypothetical protein
MITYVKQARTRKECMTYMTYLYTTINNKYDETDY